jgi:uncharacterized protein (DUF433 family)
MTPGQKVVHSDPEIMSGTPVFVGTRVPVYNLFDYLEAGDSLDVFLTSFPSVSREQAIGALELAKDALSEVAMDTSAELAEPRRQPAEAHPLEKELEYFEGHRSELVLRAKGQFALVKNDSLIGTFEGQAEAIREGYRRFGNEPFLVKRIAEVDVPFNVGSLEYRVT